MSKVVHDSNKEIQKARMQAFYNSHGKGGYKNTPDNPVTIPPSEEKTPEPPRELPEDPASRLNALSELP